MDLNRDMKIEVVTVLTDAPAAGVPLAFTGTRVLYAFQYGSGGAKGDGCICTECMTDPDRLDRIRRRCGGSPGDEPAYLEGSQQRSWQCCSCHRSSDERR